MDLFARSHLSWLTVTTSQQRWVNVINGLRGRTNHCDLQHHEHSWQVWFNMVDLLKKNKKKNTLSAEKCKYQPATEDKKADLKTQIWHDLLTFYRLHLIFCTHNRQKPGSANNLVLLIISPWKPSWAILSVLWDLTSHFPLRIEADTPGRRTVRRTVSN